MRNTAKRIREKLASITARIVTKRRMYGVLEQLQQQTDQVTKQVRRSRKETQLQVNKLTGEIERWQGQLDTQLQRQTDQVTEQVRRSRKETQLRVNKLTGEIERWQGQLDTQLQQQTDQVNEAVGRSSKETARRLEKLIEENTDIRRAFTELTAESQESRTKHSDALQQKLDALMVELRTSRKDVRRLAKATSTKADTPTSRRDHEALFHLCMKHLVPVSSPLALISQIPRSGGTLLSQLFDGHPECHVHPYELYESTFRIGYPDENRWPVLDLTGSPGSWFDTLFETRSIELFEGGYTKYSEGHDAKPETFPFILLQSLQRDIFLKYILRTPEPSMRDILNAYMTSYFNAWINNHNLLGAKKRVVAFTARLAMYADSVERLFETYPDGKLISILRQPHTWYVSARKSIGRVQSGPIEDAIGWWNESAQAMQDNQTKYGESVLIVRFEDLVCRTEATMRYLAQFLGIEFNEILLLPTFNQVPIKANSSFSVGQYGVITEPVSARRELLDAAEIEAIDRLAGDLYAEVAVRATKI